MSPPSAMMSLRLTPMRYLICRSSGAVDHPALHLGGVAHRIDDGGEFHQHAVAGGGLDDAALVLLDLRIDELPAMRLEALMCTLFVRPYQTRIPRHISGEDRGQAAGRGHGSSTPPWSK